VEHLGKSTVFLCGAGISVPPPASMASVSEFVDNLLDICDRRKIESSKFLGRCLYGDDIYRSLRFEEIITCISDVDPDLICLDFLKVGPEAFPNLFHRYLANRINKGDLVITTNFDALIEVAYWEAFGENIDEAEGRLWKIHGSLQTVHDGKIYDENTKKLKTDIVSVASGNSIDGKNFELDNLAGELNCKNISIWGYSFSDSYDVSPILKKAHPSEAIVLEYRNSKIEELDATAKILAPNFDEIGRAWRLAGTKLRPICGDLHTQLSVDLVAPIKFSISRTSHQNMTSRFSSLANLTESELSIIIGRLCMYQDAYVDANRIFEQVIARADGALYGMGLYFFLKTLQDWNKVIQYREELRETTLEPYLKLQSYIILLDASAFLVDAGAFKLIYRDFRRLLLEEKKVVSLNKINLIRAKVAHCYSIYFLTSGRPKLAEKAAQASLNGREKFGGPDDILYAQFAVCMSLAFQGDDERLRKLLVTLRIYSRRVGGIGAKIVLLIAEGLYQLLRCEPIKALKRFEDAISLYAVETKNEQRDPEIELYALVALIASNNKNSKFAGKV